MYDILHLPRISNSFIGCNTKRHPHFRLQDQRLNLKMLGSVQVEDVAGVQKNDRESVKEASEVSTDVAK